jgi:FAD/FMN-containing dehydrogenase
MRAIRRRITIPRKELANLAAAMQQLSCISIRDQQVVEEGKGPVTLHPALVDRFQRFKFWAAANAKTLKDLADAENDALYTAEESLRVEKYHFGRDAILRAFAKRDSSGHPEMVTEGGAAHYNIPAAKEAKCQDALEAHNKAYADVRAIHERVKKRAEEPISVELICVAFRDFPIIVNASYMALFDKLLLRKPRLWIL